MRGRRRLHRRLGPVAEVVGDRDGVIAVKRSGPHRSGLGVELPEQRSFPLVERAVIREDKDRIAVNHLDRQQRCIEGQLHERSMLPDRLDGGTEAPTTDVKSRRRRHRPPAHRAIVGHLQGPSEEGRRRPFIRSEVAKLLAPDLDGHLVLDNQPDSHRFPDVV